MEIQVIGFSGSNFIYTDKKRMQQVLLNLLSNAIKFTDRGGSIQIQAIKEPSKMVKLYVRDSGIGIKKKHQSKLFKMFGSIKDSKRKFNT